MDIMNNSPIGVFDSGLGGLSTVRAIRKLLPNEDIIYFGDTGRVPYGTRSNETIESYTAQDIKFLQSFDCKMIAVACGTVSTVSRELISKLPVLSTGILVPSAKAAAAATKNGKIGIMGTSATVNSGAFETEIKKYNPSATVVPVACPLLVSLVESNWLDVNDDVTNPAVRRYMKPILDNGCDTVILGCTHFPLLSPIIRNVAGEGVTLIDSGLEEAKYIEERLNAENMRNSSEHIGSAKFFVSDRPQNFSSVASVLLGENIDGSCSFVDIFKYI